MAGLLSLAVALVVPVQAQRTKQQHEEALNFREQIVADIREGRKDVAGALAQLKNHSRRSDLDVDDDGDLGLAAVDIGDRLKAVGRHEVALRFYREAEKSIERALLRNGSNRDHRVIYLRKLAEIQAIELGKPAVARENLLKAIQLHPDSQNLEDLYAFLSSRHRAEFPVRERKPRQ